MDAFVQEGACIEDQNRDISSITAVGKNQEDYLVHEEVSVLSSVMTDGKKVVTAIMSSHKETGVENLIGNKALLAVH